MQLTTLLESSLTSTSPEDSIRQAGEAPLTIIATAPDAVVSLAHDKLHAYPFKDVPLCYRRLYEDATLYKILGILKKNDDRAGDLNGGAPNDCAGEVISLLDSILLLTGAPGRKPLIESLLRSLAPLPPRRLASGRTHSHHDAFSEDEADSSPEPPRKRHRPTPAPGDTHSDFPPTFPSTLSRIPKLTHPIPRLDCPPLSTFSTHMHNSATPLILTNTITHWPALTRWQDPQYWLDCTHAGRRLVPVETGRSYTDAGWGQRICRFDEFLRSSLLRGPAAGETWYLAQHDLFHQITALRNDVAVPDYCYVDPPSLPTSDVGGARLDKLEHDPGTAERPGAGEAYSPSPSPPPQEPALNIWLGPAGTLSPAHTDPHHNLLAQVVGRKYVRLFPPSESAKLYPMSGGKSRPDENGARSGMNGGHEAADGPAIDMANTSQVDVGYELEFEDDSPSEPLEATTGKAEHDKRFPLLRQAIYVDGILAPGDVLYIPRGWWHYVRSIDVSASVSFWWD